MDLLINIDVPNLDEAMSFYTRAFGLSVARRLGAEVASRASCPAMTFIISAASRTSFVSGRSSAIHFFRPPP